MDYCINFKDAIFVTIDNQLVCTKIIYRREISSIIARLYIQI